MKLTIKDMREVLNFLDVAKFTTERAIINSSYGSSYKDAMKRQLERLEALIEKIENENIEI